MKCLLSCPNAFPTSQSQTCRLSMRVLSLIQESFTLKIHLLLFKIYPWKQADTASMGSTSMIPPSKTSALEEQEEESLTNGENGISILTSMACASLSRNTRSISFLPSRGSNRVSVSSVPVLASLPFLPLSRACTFSEPYLSPIGINRYSYKRVGSMHLLISIGVVGRNLGSNLRKPKRTKRIGDNE